MVLDLAWTPEVEALFKLYEFPSLIRLVRKISDEIGSASSQVYQAPPVRSVEVKKVAPAAITDSRVAVHLVDGMLYVADSHGVASAGPEALKELLADPSRTKVGIGLKQQVEEL